MRYQCTKCGSEKVSVVIRDTAADNVPAEISYDCDECKAHAYFSYGYYEDDVFPFRLVE